MVICRRYAVTIYSIQSPASARPQIDSSLCYPTDRTNNHLVLHIVQICFSLPPKHFLFFDVIERSSSPPNAVVKCGDGGGGSGGSSRRD